jgi:two-component system chemotaxis response regulator CheY
MKYFQVLIIDDEQLMRTLICSLLKDIGFKLVIEAENGEDGLKALATSSYPRIGLVILDINMPKLGGLEFLYALRTNPSNPNKDVPVVMLTGNSDKESVSKALELGIHGFLAKPVSKGSLEKQIQRALTCEQLR